MASDLAGGAGARGQKTGGARTSRPGPVLVRDSMDDIGALWAKAFLDDPLMVWAAPDPETRLRALTVLFGGMAEHARIEGTLLSEPGIGAVDWMEPSRYQMSVATIARSGVWRMVRWPRVAARLARHDAGAMKLGAGLWGDAPSPAYLSVLGVDPAMKGKGHGSRLLRAALESMSRGFQTCLLHTEQPGNVPFYLRHGFEVAAEALVPASGLKVWWLRRQLD
jgi:ribosomal protein S18 acetylase RimI-like enzyme